MLDRLTFAGTYCVIPWRLVIGKYPNSSAMIAMGGAAFEVLGLLSRIGKVAAGMINDFRMFRRDAALLLL